MKVLQRFTCIVKASTLESSSTVLLRLSKVTPTYPWGVAHCSCSPTNSATKSKYYTGIKQALRFGINALKKPRRC